MLANQRPISYTWSDDFELLQPLALLRYASLIGDAFPSWVFEYSFHGDPPEEPAQPLDEAEVQLRAGLVPTNWRVNVTSSEVSVVLSAHDAYIPEDERAWYRDKRKFAGSLTATTSSLEAVEGITALRTDGISWGGTSTLSASFESRLSVAGFLARAEEVLAIDAHEGDTAGYHVYIDPEGPEDRQQCFESLAQARSALGWREPRHIWVSRNVTYYRGWSISRYRDRYAPLSVGYSREEGGAYIGQMVEWVRRALVALGALPPEAVDATADLAAPDAVSPKAAERARAWIQRNDTLLKYGVAVATLLTTIVLGIATR